MRARIAPLALAVALGCGGVVQQGTGGAGGQGAATTSSTASSTSSSSGGGAAPFGECASDADCGGAPCVSLTADGYGVCIVHVDPVTHCGPGEMGCCNSDLCAGDSHCYPPFGYCGGLVGPQNECLADACQSNEDCAAGHFCVPAGVFAYPVKTCVLAACRENADCTAEPGGRCEPVEDTCCAGVFALYCVYPDGCRTKADCPPSAPICAGDPATSAATCVTAANAPQCPI